MVAESEADHSAEQEACEEHATSSERWKVESGRGCSNRAVARSFVLERTWKELGASLR